MAFTNTMPVNVVQDAADLYPHGAMPGMVLAIPLSFKQKYAQLGLTLPVLKVPSGSAGAHFAQATPEQIAHYVEVTLNANISKQQHPNHGLLHTIRETIKPVASPVLKTAFWAGAAAGVGSQFLPGSGGTTGGTGGGAVVEPPPDIVPTISGGALPTTAKAAGVVKAAAGATGLGGILSGIKIGPGGISYGGGDVDLGPLGDVSVGEFQLPFGKVQKPAATEVQAAEATQSGFSLSPTMMLVGAGVLVLAVLAFRK